jgi:methyl-accepting chemotaxis protein
VARRQFTVKARLEAEDRASPVVEKAEGRWRSFGNFLKNSFVITAGDVVRAMRSVVGVLGDVVGAAQAQEDAVRKLDAALSKYGESAGEVSAAAQEQASAIQEVSRFGDEAVIAAQALLATMGVTAEKLPEATQATADLAAAFGISLESAARNVGKTMGGFAGELGELIPELKDLDAEALQAGAGIELLADKFKGRAAADAKTFSGQLAQLKNSFGDLLEGIGFAITKNRDFGEGVAKLTTLIKENSGQIADLASRSFALLIDAAELAAVALEKVGAALEKTVGFFANWRGQVEATEASTSALEATAARLGISVDELKGRLGLAKDATAALAAASEDLADEQGAAARATAASAAATEALGDAAAPAAASTADLATALEAEAAAADAADREVDELAGTTRELREANRSTTRELHRTSDAFKLAASSAAIYNATIGVTSGGVTARSPGAQGEVDAAVAAGMVPILGGTRIRLPGGGSRLVGPRRF